MLSGGAVAPFSESTPDYFPHADDYVRYLQGFSANQELNVRLGSEVVQVRKSGEGFVLELSGGARFHCRYLVVATGLSKPNIPMIAGVEHVEHYGDISMDPMTYAGERVLIIGKGNSAFETAEAMLGTASSIHLISPSPVKFAWASKFVGDLRALNCGLIDTYQLKSQNVLLDGEVRQIVKEGSEYKVTVGYAHADGEVEDLYYDRIISCAGFRFDATIFNDTCQPDLGFDGRLPLMTSAWESSNVEGMYFAGTLMQSRDYKQKQSAFIHGFRYNIQALCQIFMTRNNGEEWPGKYVEMNCEVLTEEILMRVNRSSSLWQQTGFIGDVVVLDYLNNRAKYYVDVPIDYFHENVDSDVVYLAVTLEFGLELIAEAKDPLAIDRIHKDDVENAEKSTGIHPIVRMCREGGVISEHHVIEDIMSEWVEAVHSAPLMKFLREVLSNTNWGPT